MEKVLITSKRYNSKKILLGFFIVAIIVFVALYSIGFIYWFNHYNELVAEGITGWPVDSYSSLGFAFEWAIYDVTSIIGAIAAVVIVIIGVIVYFCLSKIELTVTDKRVYGKAIFGRHVDLPLDKISAVGLAWPKAISVATSSGRVTFFEIINRDEIYECINNLLIERQGKAKNEETKQEIHHVSGADELKKYKDLLNEGIITQEEFEAKKKQILGI